MGTEIEEQLEQLIKMKEDSRVTDLMAEKALLQEEITEGGKAPQEEREKKR